MDLAKFLLLLETKSLWFPRADQFEDPLEGTYTDGELEDLRALEGADFSLSGLSPPIGKGFHRKPQAMRLPAYVSCWRASRTESMAMWDLYGRGGVTVALKTTVRKLKKPISESPFQVFLSEVKYVDWNFGRFDNPLARCFRKDAGYEHENEVRAVILRPTQHHAKRVSSDPFTLLDGKLGIEVSFDPARFLDEVVIGPRETHAIAELVKKLLVKYGLKIKVTVSDRLKPRL